MLSKKLIVTIAMCTLLSVGIVSCTNNTAMQNKGSGVVSYLETPEAGEAENLKMANMPISYFWFPEELLQWNPKEDKDLEYNKSVVPLAKRVEKDKLTPSNNTQNKDFNVVALSIMNGSTSGNPPNGLNKFASNTFSYWQYIDKLVYWGGSSGEGIIVPPSPDVIDSAHKNGVPVLGTVFFPTTTHGGKAQWLNDFLQKDENGNFPMIDKLIEVCEVLGFDGWFINEETGLTVGENDFIDQSETAAEGAKITKEHAELLQEFIREFKKKSNLEIMWYDSITKDGKMDWQNALTDKNDYFLIDENKEKIADSMFLNFWWTNKSLADKELLKASRDRAKELGLNPYDLYAGIDVQANGTNTKVRWNLFQDEKGIPYTSLGLYAPSWTYFSSKDVDEFQNKESRLYVNEEGDPRKNNLDDTSFRGVSTYAIEKTVLNKLPFTTNFNLGNGYNYFINGSKVSSLDWNNRSLADVMPTYRWIIDNEGDNNLKAYIDYADAFYGGNSIKLTGKVFSGKATKIKLFNSDLTLESGVEFTTAVKSNSEITLSLILELEDGTMEEVMGNSKVGDSWTNVKFDIAKLYGKNIKSISYKIMSDKDVSNIKVNFGNISILDKSKVKEASVSNVSIEDKVFEEDDSYAGVRISFDSDNKENVSHYEIYKVDNDGKKMFLGATNKNKYFLNALPRDEKSNSTLFEVVPVSINMVKGKAATVKMEWPDNSMPKAKFKVSKTLVAPGEQITFESLSSKNTENLEWIFKGGTIEKDNKDSMIVSYPEEGVYSVTLVAKNSSGEDTVVMEDYITVTKDAENYKNLAFEKSSEASSFVNNNEAPKFAFDGKLDTKWCAVGTPPHNITVDLGDSYLISEVKMAHAEAGNESPDMNTSDYTIEISEDGKTFTEVVNVKKNSKANTSDTFKAVKARYVKITAIKPTQGSDSAVRLYEIEVNGIEK